MNDLKQANAALITAFEKAKSKYLARIRKLEVHGKTPARSTAVRHHSVDARSNPPSLLAPSSLDSGVHNRLFAVVQHRPLPATSPQSTSDVYEVIQDSSSSWNPQDTANSNNTINTRRQIFPSVNYQRPPPPQHRAPPPPMPPIRPHSMQHLNRLPLSSWSQNGSSIR